MKNGAEFPQEIHIDLHFSGIHVDIECGREVHIDLQFNLTKKELSYIMEMVGGKGAKRRQRIAKYYFALKHTINDIAGHLGISSSMVHKELITIRRGILGRIKDDLRTNKKILGHMVELMIQTDNRINEAWLQYQNLDADAKIVGRVIREHREQIAKDREEGRAVTQGNLETLTEALNAVMRTHKLKQGYLATLREESKAMLQIWKDFGLCGEEAVKVMFEGGIDVDSKVEEVKTFLEKVIYIIRNEVTDSNAQTRVFTRLANEIRESKFYGKPSVKDAEIVQE